MLKVLTIAFALALTTLPNIQAQDVAKESVIPAQSCHLDYIERRRQLTRRALLTPLVGAVAFPLGIYGGAAYGNAVSSGDGWAALGYAILGGYGALLATLGVEATTIYQIVKVNALAKLIEESYVGEGHRLERYTKMMRRKLGREITPSEVADAITKADMSGILCDGSMRGRSVDAKLRKRLARRSEIKSYLLRVLR